MTTTNKALTQPAHGSTSPTWDVPLNADLGIIDSFFSVTALSVTGHSGVVTLTATQYQPSILVVSGTLSADVNYQLPTGVAGFWFVSNGSTGAHNLVFSSAGGG